jgi:hypothetical protein
MRGTLAGAPPAATLSGAPRSSVLVRSLDGAHAVSSSGSIAIELPAIVAVSHPALSEPDLTELRTLSLQVWQFCYLSARLPVNFPSGIPSGNHDL